VLVGEVRLGEEQQLLELVQAQQLRERVLEDGGQQLVLVQERQ
jgi:hypothetical protein